MLIKNVLMNYIRLDVDEQINCNRTVDDGTLESIQMKH